MAQFILRIKLGNEAMQTPNDIARALNDVADRVECTTIRQLKNSGSLKVMDLNGNSVGSWQIK